MFGIGGVIDGIFMLCNMCDGKDWKVIYFIIIVCMIVIWFFWCYFFWFNVIFKDNFGVGRYF